MDWIQYLLIGFYGLWFVISIAWQFQFRHELVEKIKSYDVVGIIPNWTFFAPNPGTSDYHLIYRDQLTDGSIGSWHEISVTNYRGQLDWLWNPHKRKNKLLMDCVNHIARLSRKIKEKSKNEEPVSYNHLCLTVPYMLLLNLVCNGNEVAAEENSKYRQFAIVKSDGYIRKTNPDLIIRSSYHSIKM
ncbi:hypothetical protein [Mucilaginibacter sp.]|jgi:hypothetical protein|uniref:hypothetical protein n=1 Tax=Mucilaginibacter sp. TaxID=1882438 RepID=UPI003569DAC7